MAVMGLGILGHQGFGMWLGVFVGHHSGDVCWKQSHSNGCGYICVEEADVVSGPPGLFSLHLYSVAVRG